MPPMMPGGVPTAMGVSPPGAAGGLWPELGAAGGGGSQSNLLPAARPPGFFQSMAGGGAAGGDYSRDAAYRSFVARQASVVEERQLRRAGSRPGSSAAGLNSQAAAGAGPSGAGGGGDGSREASHVLARQMAPTYSHSTSEDAELGGLVMQVVGGAIRSRLNRGHSGKEASKKGDRTPDKKKKRKNKKGKDSGSNDSRSGNKSAAAAGASSGGASSSTSVDAETVSQMIAELLGALAGHDARCTLPVFSQQVAVLNQRLGKASDSRQIEQLFWAVQANGVVDFAEFLRRESTRAYFQMDNLAA